MTEAEFQRGVIELAQLSGWLVAHFRPAQTMHGWKTPVSGDGKGFPDLVMARERVIYRELKAQRGTLSMDQLFWGDALRRAGADYAVWRPKDWPQIEEELRRS